MLGRPISAADAAPDYYSPSSASSAEFVVMAERTAGDGSDTDYDGCCPSSTGGHYDQCEDVISNFSADASLLAPSLAPDGIGSASDDEDDCYVPVSWGERERGGGGGGGRGGGVEAGMFIDAKKPPSWADHGHGSDGEDTSDADWKDEAAECCYTEVTKMRSTTISSSPLLVPRTGDCARTPSTITRKNQGKINKDTFGLGMKSNGAGMFSAREQWTKSPAHLKKSFDQLDTRGPSGGGSTRNIPNALLDEAMPIHSKGKYEEALRCFTKHLSSSKGAHLDLRRRRQAGGNNGHNVRGSWFGPVGKAADTNDTNKRLRTIVKLALDLTSDQNQPLSLWNTEEIDGDGDGDSNTKYPPRTAFNLDDAASGLKTERVQAMELYVEALKSSHGEGHGLARTLTRMGHYFKDRGGEHRHLDEAMVCYEESLRLYDAQPEHKSLDCADMLDKMSIIHNMRGKHRLAIEREKEALGLYKAELGDHVQVASSLHNLGSFLAVVGKFKKSKRAFERALELRRKLLGGMHEDVAATLYNLSSTYNCMGNHAQSLKCLKEALAIRQSRRKSVLGGNHDKVAVTLQRIGDVYKNMGDKAKACKYYEEVLKARKQELDDDSTKVAAALQSLGELEHDRKDNLKAMAHLQQSLEMRKAVLGDHEDVATTLCSIATIHCDQGDKEAALECMEECLKIRKERLGLDHSLVGDTHNNIAYYFCSMGKYEDAKDHLLEALRVRELRKSFEEVADTLSNLGEVHKHMGDGKMAVACYEEELKARKQKMAGVDSLLIANAYLNMGDSYVLLDEFSRAKESYEEALRVRMLEEGQGNPKVVDIHSRMVVVYLKKMEHSMALERLDEMLRLKKLEIGRKNHADVANILCNMGFVHCSTGDRAGALRKFRAARSMFASLGCASEAAHMADLINNVQVMEDKKPFSATKFITRFNEVCGMLHA